MLSESQILKSAGELGLLVDQARGGARRAAGEKRGAKNYRKNNRCNIHDIFLSSSGVNQMENEVQAQDRIDDCHEGQASQWQCRPVAPERIQKYQQGANDDFPVDQRPQKPPSINGGTHEGV